MYYHSDYGPTTRVPDVRTGPLDRPFARSFAHTAHSFVCSIWLASLARYAALICSLARSLLSSWETRLFWANSGVSLRVTASWLISPRCTNAWLCSASLCYIFRWTEIAWVRRGQVFHRHPRLRLLLNDIPPKNKTVDVAGELGGSSGSCCCDSSSNEYCCYGNSNTKVYVCCDYSSNGLLLWHFIGTMVLERCLVTNENGV